MQKLIEIRDISVLPSSSRPHSRGLLYIPGVDPKPSHLGSLLARGPLGLEGCPGTGCSPCGQAGYGRQRIGCIYIFLSERQNGGCPQGFCWHEEFGEGEGALACWAGGAASRWRVMLGRTGHGSARLPSHLVLLLSPAAFEGCHDLSPCPEASVLPAGLPTPPKFMAPVSRGAQGCRGFVGTGGSKVVPPPPHPGALPAPLAGCSLRLCPELSAWSNPVVLPRAPGA